MGGFNFIVFDVAAIGVADTQFYVRFVLINFQNARNCEHGVAVAAIVNATGCPIIQPLLKHVQSV